jgi:hypothetical protein
VVEVIFDGTLCALSPGTVEEGDRAVVLTNSSDLPLGVNDLYLINAHPDHTFAELVEIQNDAGGPGVYFPEPEWEVPEDLNKDEMRSYAPTPDGLELTEDQVVSMWVLTPGTDWVMLGTQENIWLCGEMEVTPR